MPPRREWWWGRARRLASRSIHLREVNWLAGTDRALRLRGQGALHAPARGGARDAFGRRRARGWNSAAEEAIAPGQACVFYDGSRVLGGGWIKAAAAVPGRSGIAVFPIIRAILTAKARRLLHPPPRRP